MGPKLKMYSFLSSILLTLVSLTNCLNQNSSFPSNIGNWSVNCEETSTLGPSIRITGSLRFQYGPSSEQFVDMPSSPNLVNVSSICNDEQQFIELHWASNNSSGIKEKKVWLGLTFTKQLTQKDTYGLSTVRYLNFENMETLFKEIKLNPAYTTKINHSFSCQPQKKFTSCDDPNMYLLTENLKFQAFMENEDDDNFGIAEDCEPLNPPFNEQRLDTGVLIGMSIAVAMSGILGAGIGFYLCKKYLRQDI